MKFMKKYIFIMMAALVGFTSCGDDFLTSSPTKNNRQARLPPKVLYSLT